MLGSIPHQKFYFYHLPTRGRAGIKLGDAWFVSNVSIIFDCSMLLYYLFWMFHGLWYTFLYFFGTNLLTEGPVQIAVFLPVSVFHGKGISNGIQTEWNLREDLFGTNAIQETWSGSQGSNEEAMRQEGVPQGGGRAPHPRGQPETLLAQLVYSMAFFWSKNKFREVSGQVDSI